MGDADELRESGLGWGWADGDGNAIYPNFREKPSARERWKSRKNQSRLLVKDLEVDDLALQLIEVKKKIRRLAQEEEKIKKRLLETMPQMGWVSMVDHDGEYIVEHLVRRRKSRLNASAALSLISKKFGKEAALQIAEQCSENSIRKTAIYVRRFPRNDNDE